MAGVGQRGGCLTGPQRRAHFLFSTRLEIALGHRAAELSCRFMVAGREEALAFCVSGGSGRGVAALLGPQLRDNFLLFPVNFLLEAFANLKIFRYFR